MEGPVIRIILALVAAASVALPLLAEAQTPAAKTHHRTHPSATARKRAQSDAPPANDQPR